MFYAYIHCRPDTSVFYVGKGVGNRAHRITKGRNQHHRNITAKYGKENILVGKLHCSSEEIAFELEKGLIKCLKRSGVNLSNLTDGGEGCSGLIVSDEHKLKLSMALKGKPLSDETKVKMSKSRKLVKSVLTKKCREASVAIRSLPVNSYNLEGNFIQNHPSIKQASKDTGVSPAQIRFCCIDEAWSAKGYQFRFNKGDEGINISPYIKNPSIKRKSISMYSENWEYIRDFDSVKDAAKHFNVNTIVIYKSHKKGGKLTTLGYRFKLKDN